jgi:hypothetical protein
MAQKRDDVKEGTSQEESDIPAINQLLKDCFKVSRHLNIFISSISKKEL